MPRILLIVDDCEEVARGLRRLLKHRFAEVHVASSADEADGYFAREHGRPTHLLCDYALGVGQPTGAELVRRWRAQHAGVVNAVVFSVAELSGLPDPRGVDHFFGKPLDLDAIEQYFAEAEAVPAHSTNGDVDG